MLSFLLDTDIILDLALNRKPFSTQSARLIDRLEMGEAHGFIAWHSISNFYYIVRPSMGRVRSVEFISDLLKFVEIAPTRTNDALVATKLDFGDFEDALQSAAAMSCGADYIVTRNLKHYARSPIKALMPKAAVDMLEK